jgi:hypothetical protein
LHGEGVESYGVGFWFRWLQRYPQEFYHGKKDDRYFMAQLSDGTQSVFDVYMGQEELRFGTYDG